MSKDIYKILESLEKVNPTPKAEEVYVPVKSKLEETIEQISEDHRLTDAVTERIVKNIERNFPELMLRHGEEQVRSIAHEEAAALTDGWPEDEGFGSSDAYGPYKATVERLGGSLAESDNYDHDSFDDEDMEYVMQQGDAAEKERKEKPKFDIERDYDFDEAAQKFTQGGKTYVTGGDEGDEVVQTFDDPGTAQKFMDVNRTELNKNDPDPEKIATVDNLEKDDKNNDNMHKTNEGFGDYDDFGEQEMSVLDPITTSAVDVNGDGEVDIVNPELADFDPDDPTQRSRLQRGTKVMLSPVLFSDADSDRCGTISNMAPSGFNFKVIRDSDGKEINVHINDILKADLFNNTVYEELDVDFQKKLDELLEDITITRTENPEDPELDTITITGTEDDAQALADMMRNAGLNQGEYTSVEEPETALEPEEPVPGEDYVDGEQELYAEMQRDIDHANTPDEVTGGVGAVLQGGGLNKRKRQFNPWHAADNAMAIDEEDALGFPVSDELYMQIVDMLSPEYTITGLDLGDNGTINVQCIDDMGRTKDFVYNPESNMLESEIVDEKWGEETQTPKSKQGMFAGKTEAELKSALSKLKASGPHEKGSAAYKKQNELEFALRAKHNWGKVPEGQEINEMGSRSLEQVLSGFPTDELFLWVGGDSNNYELDDALVDWASMEHGPEYQENGSGRGYENVWNDFRDQVEDIARDREQKEMAGESITEKWDTKSQTPKSERGKYAGKTQAELKSMLSKLRASGPHKKGSPGYEKQKELNFALRAKHNWGKVPEGQEVDEVSAPGQESWIRKHKKEFIDRYGKDKGLSVLYATAWKRHNNESIGESDVDEAFGFRDDDEYGEWKYEQDRDKEADKDHPFVPMNKMNDAQRAAMKPKKREESVTESDWYTKFRGIETAGKVAVTESVKAGDKIKYKKNGKGQTRTGTVSDVDTKKGYAYIHNGATAVDIQDIVKENAPQVGAPISDEVDSFLNLYKAFGERGEKR